MGSYSNFDEVREAVDRAGGVVTVAMGELRDAYGAERLGPFIVESISATLRGLGLGHYPPDLPLSQWEQVRLYRVGSEPGRLIEAVLHRDPSADRTIVEAGGKGATETLRKIRELVCE